MLLSSFALQHLQFRDPSNHWANLVLASAIASGRGTKDGPYGALSLWWATAKMEGEGDVKHVSSTLPCTAFLVLAPSPHFWYPVEDSDVTVLLLGPATQ